jgi:hypothetical protein
VRWTKCGQGLPVECLLAEREHGAQRSPAAAIDDLGQSEKDNGIGQRRSGLVQPSRRPAGRRIAGYSLGIFGFRLWARIRI